MLSAIHSRPLKSPDNIPYLDKPGAALISKPDTNLFNVKQYLDDQDFPYYVYDQEIDPGATLMKFAGQLCYLSFGEKRRKNDKAKEYFDNIKEHKHGSVFEHANYSFLLYGIDRAVTHELVRHRSGMAYSQISQRYVGPDAIRYCLPRDLNSEVGRAIFFKDIKDNVDKYTTRINYLEETLPTLGEETRTEKRKRVQSFARRVLANEVEAPIVVTGNVRSWRHVLTMRLGKAADVGIREPMFLVYQILKEQCPFGFDDFEEETLSDGSKSAKPRWEKV